MASKIAATIVISTRNRAHYLPDTLRTLAEQRCEAGFEVIVVDNGSTDNTPAVLERWSNRDPRFVTTREPRVGLSCGKNTGIRLARAPLVLFTDDDTLVHPGWIQSYLELFSHHTEELILAGGPQMPVPDDLGPWP